MNMWIIVLLGGKNYVVIIYHATKSDPFRHFLYHHIFCISTRRDRLCSGEKGGVHGRGYLHGKYMLSILQLYSNINQTIKKKTYQNIFYNVIFLFLLLLIFLIFSCIPLASLLPFSFFLFFFMFPKYRDITFIKRNEEMLRREITSKWNNQDGESLYVSKVIWKMGKM